MQMTLKPNQRSRRPRRLWARLRRRLRRPNNLRWPPRKKLMNLNKRKLKN
jgi:hypothetical protein